MRVEPRAVLFSEKSELWSDLQDYIEEMRTYDDDIERVDGAFQYKWFDHYWQDEQRWPFWAVADGARSGFALLRREVTGEMDIAEFYIRPRFRRGGIGVAFARELLAAHPGRWLISEYKANFAAVAFWRKVIEPYAFTEEAYIGDSGRPRLLQRVMVVKG
jgi:predicted acetyltransferase